MWTPDELEHEISPTAVGETGDGFATLSERLAPLGGRLCLAWPSSTAPADLGQFDSFDQWQSAVAALDLSEACAAPAVVRAKFRRSQKLYLLAWLDADAIAAGEMAAFTALELALNDQFAPAVAALIPRRRARTSIADRIETPPLSSLLDYLVTHAGIREEDFPTALVGGGRVVDRLRKGPNRARPSLVEMRNRYAHGDPFEGLPLCGLLHVIRDLIHFIYK